MKTTHQLHDSPYLLNSFLNQFQELVISRGGDFKRLCESAGLTASDVSGPTTLIPFDRFVALLELADEALDVDDLALTLVSRQNISILGPVSLMLLECQDLKDAVERIQRFLHLLVYGIYIDWEITDTRFILTVDAKLPSLAKRDQFHTYLIGSVLTISRQLHGSEFIIHSCELIQFEPGVAKKQAVSKFLGCTPQYGCPQIRVIMDRDILNDQPKLNVVSPSYQYRNVQTSRRAIESSVRDALISGMLIGDTSITYVSSLLGYSERTLRRRLQDLSLSFSDILDATRIAQANKYLQSSHYRLCDIAALLGYANQSAFTRSYQRCCGITPSQFRNGLSKGHLLNADPNTFGT